MMNQSCVLVQKTKHSFPIHDEYSNTQTKWNMIHFIFNWLYFHFFKEIYLNGLIFERMALYCNNFPVLILFFKNVNSRESVTQHLCLFKKIFFCILLNYILERSNTESMVLSQINWSLCSNCRQFMNTFLFPKRMNN